MRLTGDTYPSGAPVNIEVLGDVERGVVPLVRWSLPDGGRILGTLVDFNSSFPFVHANEAKWRNAANAAKRWRMMNDADRKAWGEWDDLCRASGRWPAKKEAK